MIFGWGFPGVLPKATLTMAVGQMWGGGEFVPGLKPRLRWVWPLANSGAGCGHVPGLKPRLRFLFWVSGMLWLGYVSGKRRG